MKNETPEEYPELPTGAMFSVVERFRLESGVGEDGNYRVGLVLIGIPQHDSSEPVSEERWVMSQQAAERMVEGIHRVLDYQHKQQS